MNYYYDFHIHTALSPCAEDEMTPNNIVNMAMISGLDLIAVTDHNATANLPAIAKCAAEKGIVFVPGIEVESAEEVHISCLFPTVEAAQAMGQLVKVHLLPLENQEDVLGAQYIFDAEDNIVGKEARMLLFASDLGDEEIFGAARDFGGCAYFSHVDRDSYSVLSVLGSLPETIHTGVVEVSNTMRGREFLLGRKDLRSKSILFSSDCHRLADMSGRENWIDLPVDRQRLTAQDVINWIREKDLR